MGLAAVARGIRRNLRVEEVSRRRIGAREARRNETLLGSYLEQNPAASEDYHRRIVANRPFIGWDGEGYTDHVCGKSRDDCPGNGCAHHYMLFGASTGDYIAAGSLGTEECLQLLLDVERKNPNTFHVIFAGNYDVNMILKDLDRNSLLRLKATNKVVWRGYRLEYLKSKWFQVTKDHVTCTLYDVFTFFACSFVKALEEYIGEDNQDVQRIKAGKERRNEFTIAEISEVQRYWSTELQYLVRLCDTLRNYLTTAGIRISRWHGPGAVAGTVLRTRHYKRVTVPEPVSVASQYAYYGGRFEARQIGRYDGPVYQYDIRSAYPAAIRYLPNLSTGEWLYNPLPTSITSFGLYHVRISNGMPATYTGMGPIPWRSSNGAVYYPTVAHGGTWIWGCELSAIMSTHWKEMVEVLEAWEFQDNGHRPFQWIEDTYNQRAAWKLAGNPAQLALKLAMNSIYGKLAQQIGAEWKDGKWRLPTYHQLEFAGFITAHARAQLYRAVMLKPESVIAVETDAVFTTSPLPLDIGTSLGQWEESRYSGIAYLQSGLYFARGKDGQWKPKTRGFARNRLDPTNVFTWLSDTSGYSSKDRPYRVTDRRFRTIGTHIGKPEWRRWVNETREITIGLPGGKREHYPLACSLCTNAAVKSYGNRREESSGPRLPDYGCGLHTTVPALSRQFDTAIRLDYQQESTRYPLVWCGDPPKEYVDPAGDSVEWGEVYG